MIPVIAVLGILMCYIPGIMCWVQQNKELDKFYEKYDKWHITWDDWMVGDHKRQDK